MTQTEAVKIALLIVVGQYETLSPIGKKYSWKPEIIESWRQVLESIEAGATLYIQPASSSEAAPTASPGYPTAG